ncbi:unnamed protein product [Acanthosepion pharaonis]|uniref:Uncharacterized protein n=1 Tax=Acanthosepion pharaonis TaxID=158019 RepID=A0A812DUR3_ACAPH|nr:unnamed protein product [Sepia pharaonis]
MNHDVINLFILFFLSFCSFLCTYSFFISFSSLSLSLSLPFILLIFSLFFFFLSLFVIPFLYPLLCLFSFHRFSLFFSIPFPLSYFVLSYDKFDKGARQCVPPPRKNCPIPLLISESPQVSRINPFKRTRKGVAWGKTCLPQKLNVIIINA